MPTLIHYTANRCGVVATFNVEQETIAITLTTQTLKPCQSIFLLEAGFEGGGAISGVFYCVDKICSTSAFCSSSLFKSLCEKIQDDVQQKRWLAFTQQVTT